MEWYDGEYYVSHSMTVIEDEPKEYHVRYKREYDDEPFTLIFREKKRSIGFRSWK